MADRKPGITPIEFWEQGFTSQPFFNDIEKILEFPDTKDMAGILARGNFRNEKQRIAAVRLAYKNRKFRDEGHQNMLRDAIASSIGSQGLGKMLQLQIGTNLLMPQVNRELVGMKKGRKEEQVEGGQKRTDFRESDVIGNGNNGHKDFNR